MGTLAAPVRTYRFWDNVRDVRDVIAAPFGHDAGGGRQMALAMLVQDWTTLDYSALPKTQGIGHWGRGVDRSEDGPDIGCGRSARAPTPQGSPAVALPLAQSG